LNVDLVRRFGMIHDGVEQDLSGQLPCPPGGDHWAWLFGVSRLRGETDDLVGDIIGEHGGDQVGEQSGAGESRGRGGQFIEAADGFQPLEAKFDLPAVAIERDDPLRRLAGGGQRAAR
jgi:hypothetical protein